MPDQNLAIFTICSNNYLPTARAFLTSVRRFYPGTDLFVCLADRLMPHDGLYSVDANIVPIETLAIPDLPGLTFRYDIMELNTAVKPFMFLHLFETCGYSQVLYFDPDIELFAPLDAILDPLAEGAVFTLTPHVLQPSESAAEPNDLSFLRSGIYNLGFLGARNSPEALNLLRWWSRRLLYQCIDDQAAGLFVDQKFIDLLPAFVGPVAIVRDSTLNVAYWNLDQRMLAHDANEHDGGWTVDGRPLVFFHYSGFDPRRPTRLSKHTTRFNDEVAGPLAVLLQGYAARLLALRHGAPHGLYAYGRFASGTPIPDVVRRLFRDRHAGWPSDPFETFEAHLHRPWCGEPAHSSSAVVTNLQAYLHETLPHLQAGMDLQTASGQDLLVDWFLKHAARELALDERLVEPTAIRFGDRLPAPPGSRLDRDCGRDVSVIGDLRPPSGIDAAGNSDQAALSIGALNLDGYDVSLGASSSHSAERVAPLLAERPTGRVRVFDVGADQLPLVTAQGGPLRGEPAYTVAMPFWELSEFPDAWLPAFDAVDEVWAPSRYIQLMLARKLHLPVLHMPLALALSPTALRRRHDFGLPENRYLFFFAFDYLSCTERKNPAGLVEAFRRLQRQTASGAPPPGLVLKALNSSHAPEALIALHDEIARNPDIFLVEQTLTSPELSALLGLCDAVVSLHRAEGFGLLVAEAMLLGRPVIATDYAATTELVTPSTGFPVEQQAIAVAPGDYPFSEGQVWADPDLDHAAWLMGRLAAEPALAEPLVAAAQAQVSRDYSPQHAARRQHARLRELGLVGWGRPA